MRCKRMVSASFNKKYWTIIKQKVTKALCVEDASGYFPFVKSFQNFTYTKQKKASQIQPAFHMSL
jgi:hypothetical protein